MLNLYKWKQNCKQYLNLLAVIIIHLSEKLESFLEGITFCSKKVGNYLQNELVPNYVHGAERIFFFSRDFSLEKK